jgi:hypothetical protein
LAELSATRSKAFNLGVGGWRLGVEPVVEVANNASIHIDS